MQLSIQLILGVVGRIDQFITDTETFEQILGIGRFVIVSFVLVGDHTGDLAFLEERLDRLAVNTSLIEHEDDRRSFGVEQAE